MITFDRPSSEFANGSVAAALPSSRDETYVRVLVVDDDEDDFLIVRELLAEIEGARFAVEWVSEPDAAMAILTHPDRCDVCFLDHRLGRHNGLDVLRDAVARGVTVPIILLTGLEDGEADREAVRIGASDYLVKGRINSILIDRAIRYARQQRLTLEALRQQTDFVSAILETAGALIVALDREGRIARFNRQCERTTGYTFAEVKGRVVWSFLLAPEDRQQIRDAFAGLSHGQLPPRTFENDWITQSGESRRIEWSNAPLYGLDGSIEYIVSTGIDVTERRRAEMALARAREREIEVGGSIQRTLLVREPPQSIPGLGIAAASRPSQKVGGDYFDFFVFDDATIDVLVGDVMGKGVPAALLAAATKNHFQRAVRRLGFALAPYQRIPEPEEIVAAVHANLTAELVQLNSFVTLAYARFDLRRRVVTFVDCGHPRPLHVVHETGECRRISGENVPLGMSEGERYRQMTTAFAPGDLFFFYSDGLSEANDRRDDEFGEERVVDVVCQTAGERGGDPRAVTQAALAAVGAFSEGSAAILDDLTCVAIQVRPWEAPRREAFRVTEFRSDPDELEKVRYFVQSFCREEAGAFVAEEIEDLLTLAVNEAVANSMEHAYRGRKDGRIQLEATLYACGGDSGSEADGKSYRELRFRLFDNGEPFRNRGRVPEPSFDGSREDGFGLFIIEQCFDRVEHRREDMGRNSLTMVKRLDESASETESRSEKEQQ